MARPDQRPDDEIGTGTFPLFVVWTAVLLALIGLYFAVGVLHE